MNRVNPLHIAILLVVVLGFMLFKLTKATDEYHESKDSYKQTLTLANELSGLKKVYADKNKIKKDLQKILRHSSLRSASIEKTLKKNNMTITSQSIDMTGLNFLLGKVLNATYQINTLKVKQLSETKASLFLEIKW